MSTRDIRSNKYTGWRKVTTSFAVTNEELLYVDSTAGPLTITLPNSVVGMGRRLLIVVDVGGKAATNNITIAPRGTDTIAGSTVLNINNQAQHFFDLGTGVWQSLLSPGGVSGNFQTSSSIDGQIAHAGGGQGSATPITYINTRFTTVASAGDSSVLPSSAPGLDLTIANAGANSMNVFPASGDSVNALAVNTAFAVPANKTAFFVCFATGSPWHSVLSA